MPKKFVGENSKAVVARARKAAAKEAENSKKAQEAEDRMWKDDDKQILKKKQKQVITYLFVFFVVFTICTKHTIRLKWTMFKTVLLIKKSICRKNSKEKGSSSWRKKLKQKHC